MDFMSLAQMHQRPEDPYLPPGFRFHPTDEEIIYYLTRKVLFSTFRISAITEVDLNKCEPWDLPGKAAMGEKEWYFYTLRDRKYPTGMRTNRATEAGYWKATGKDRNILSSRNQCLVGMKKTLVFYRGRAPKGLKSNWIMHEYRLDGEVSHLNRSLKLSKDSEWVICRIFQKLPGGKKALITRDLNTNSNQVKDSSSQVNLPHASLPPLRDDSPRVTVTELETSETSQPSFSENSYPRSSSGVFQRDIPQNMNILKANQSAYILAPPPLLENYSFSSTDRQDFSVAQPDISSLKALDQFSRSLAGPYSKAGIRACKLEPKVNAPSSFHMNPMAWLNQQHSLVQAPQNYPTLQELTTPVLNTVVTGEMDTLWSY